MAKLAVFCDGTWNGVRMTHLTNVARLARSVAAFGTDQTTGAPVRQVVFYDEGVGVKSGVSRVNDEIEGLLGGAFGRGLDHRIEAAYRFLAMNYQPSEDELYIFGFSRGAYTARSLCGLIRKCGILRRDCLARIPEAMALYRDTRQHPAGPECVAFRDRFAHPQITGVEGMTERERRQSDSLRLAMMDSAKGSLPDDLSIMPPETRQRAVRIRYLGLWDSVGALGVPNRYILLRGFNRKYQFHDTDASRLIEALRHAAAVDEDRKVFEVTPVSNIHTLNIAAAAARPDGPLQVSDPDQPDYQPYDERPYQQKWFPGDHGAVGGGNAEPGLSSAALLWVRDGAEAAGLAFDTDPAGDIRDAERLQNPCAEYRIRKNGATRSRLALDFLGLAGGYAARRWPITEDELHGSTRARLATMAAYRPPLLERLTGKKHTPPHQTLAAVVSPLVRFLLMTLVVVLPLAALAVLVVFGLGLQAAAGHRELLVSTVRTWLLALAG